MKILNLLWLLPLWVYCAISQIVTVKDKDTGEVLDQVMIYVEHNDILSGTNDNGQANISGFTGSGRIEFHRIGYKTEILSYTDIENAGFEVRLSPTLFDLNDVVVSATRWKQKGSDVPSKIVAISAHDIALQNPQTAADLLTISGKVFMQKSQQGGGSPMIRGFATNRLLYTVDGVRMNTAIFRGGNIQNVISLDPFAIDNTEVFFGPGSVIYGSDAIGGVMGFETLTPQLSFSGKTLVTGSAATRYSTANDEKTSHFDINIGSEKWAAVTSFSSNDYGDLRMGSNGPAEYLRPFYVQRRDGTDVVITNDDQQIQRPSGYSQINMMQKLRFKPNSKLEFRYGFHYSETSDYARYDRHIRYRNGLPRYGEWSYGPQKWMMNNLNIDHYDNFGFYDQLTIRLAQQSFEESRIDRDINDPERHTRIEEVGAYSLNLDFNKAVNLRHKLVYGLEIVHNKVTSTGADKDIVSGVSVKGPSRYPQATWVSYGVYLSDQYKVSDKMLLQAGLRYNQFSIDADFDTTFYPFPFTKAKLNNGALTASFGAVLRPEDQWVLSANLATAFRSPNVDDIGKVFDSEPGSVVIPNPDLDAEYAYNADLGIARVLADMVKIDLTGYYTVLRNALVRRDYTLNGMDSIFYDGTLSQVQAIQNAAVATVYGLQAGIEIKLDSGFGFSSDINFQKGEEELDDGSKSPSRHAPPWFGTSRLTYTANKLNLELYAVYSGGKKFKDLPEEEKGKTEIYAVDKNGNPWSPGWYTLNFKAYYQFASHFSVSTGLENLTDRRYKPYSSGIAAPGRNFVMQLRADF